MSGNRTRRVQVGPRSGARRVGRPRSATPSHFGLSDLLSIVAREVSNLVESGRLPRDLRSLARHRLMEAWMASSARRRGSKPRRAETAHLHALVRDLDRLIASFSGGCPPTIDHLVEKWTRPTLSRLEVGIRRPDRGFDRRIQTLEHFIAEILRRTDFMVEHAVQTLEQGRLGTLRSLARSDREGREPLELVWGETER